MGPPHSLLLLLSWLSTGTLAGEVARPRGVGPEFAKFYKSPSVFTCISHPSLSIPSSKINDDYCDCPDGSDEPGTSACSYLSPFSPVFPGKIGGSGIDHRGDHLNTSLTLPGFYCKNKGHRPAYIPFTHVNDGACDVERCCDGSDEWARIGGVVCVDRCKEIGKEWRKLDEARKKSYGAGVKRRKELEMQAVTMRKQVEEEVVVAEGRVMAAEENVRRLQMELEEVEKRERGKVVKGAGGGGGGGMNVLVGLARERMDELKGILTSVKSQRDVALQKVTELEGVLAKFKEEYNPNFNDEGVKRAVRSWEEYAARKDSGATTEEDMSAQERDLEAVLKGEDEGINWDEWLNNHTPVESDVDNLYNLQAYLPPSLRSWLQTKMASFKDYLITNGLLAPSSSSSSFSSSSSEAETPALTSARSALTQAQSDLSAQQSHLSPLQDDLKRDFGPDEVFRPLKEKCFNTDQGEYTYEVCFLGSVTQKPNKGGGNVHLGRFERFEEVIVDDGDDDDDGGGDDGGDGGDDGDDEDGNGNGKKKSSMKYENGQQCWNGPVRQTTVVLSCDEKDGVVKKVVEEEKCVYRIDVGTAAVCHSSRNHSKTRRRGRKGDSSKRNEDDVKQEL